MNSQSIQNVEIENVRRAIICIMARSPSDQVVNSLLDLFFQLRFNHARDLVASAEINKYQHYQRSYELYEQVKELIGNKSGVSEAERIHDLQKVENVHKLMVGLQRVQSMYDSEA